MSVAHKEENNVENLRRSQRRGRILPKPWRACCRELLHPTLNNLYIHKYTQCIVLASNLFQRRNAWQLIWHGSVTIRIQVQDIVRYQTISVEINEKTTDKVAELCSLHIFLRRWDHSTCAHWSRLRARPLRAPRLSWKIRYRTFTWFFSLMIKLCSALSLLYRRQFLQ